MKINVRKSLAKVRTEVPRYVPIVAWLPSYQRVWLTEDLVSGVSIWGLQVPVAMAFASLAGLSPQAGLYTAFAALLAYAVFGTSRQLKVTTSSTMAVMSAALVAPLAAGNADLYVVLSVTLAMLIGISLIAAGIAHLGAIADFLSKSIVVGFIFGVALNIIIGQLPKLFGVPAGSGNFFEQLRQLILNLPQTNPWTLLVSVITIGVIILVNKAAPRVPATLVALVVSILVVTVFNLAEHGVSVVGVIETTFIAPSLSSINFAYLPILITGAIGIMFLAVGESLGAARAFATKYGYELDADQELLALGAANVSSALFQGFTVDASLSQTAAADEARARTQLSSIVTSILVLLTVLLLAPVFKNLPNAALGAIVIVGARGLLDVGEMKRFYAIHRADFWLAVIALVGVITTGVLVGLMIAVLLSVLRLIYQASQPRMAVLGKVPGQYATFSDITRNPANEPVPGLVVLRLDAALYFFNANTARTQILNAIARSTTPPQGVLLDIAATADMDVTTTDMLDELAVELHKKNIEILLAEARGPVRDTLRRTGTMRAIGEDHVYLSVAAAVADFERRQASTPAPSPDQNSGDESASPAEATPTPPESVPPAKEEDRPPE